MEINISGRKQGAQMVKGGLGGSRWKRKGGDGGNKGGGMESDVWNRMCGILCIHTPPHLPYSPSPTPVGSSATASSVKPPGPALPGVSEPPIKA